MGDLQYFAGLGLQEETYWLAQLCLAVFVFMAVGGRIFEQPTPTSPAGCWHCAVDFATAGMLPVFLHIRPLYSPGAHSILWCFMSWPGGVTRRGNHRRQYHSVHRTVHSRKVSPTSKAWYTLSAGDHAHLNRRHFYRVITAFSRSTFFCLFSSRARHISVYEWIMQ